MINATDFKQAIQSIEALGVTPTVLVKIAELTRDPDTDLDTICTLLKNDGPLVADIIRISNSPYYAPATFHSNLTAAMNYVGLREVNRVLSLCLARRLFARDLNSYGISAGDYWSLSVATALVMEALAKQSGLNADDAYTIGILHAIGRVLINHVIERGGFRIFWDSAEPIEEWDRNAVGFDFAEAGAMLLEHWSFPAETCNIVRGQLKPVAAGEPLSLLGALQFTQRVLALTGWDLENQDWQLAEPDGYLQASGLTSEQVHRLVAACQQKYASILETVDLK